MTDRNAVIVDAMPNYRDRLYSLTRRYLPNPHASADDLAQEGYIAMWRAVDGAVQADSPVAWLITAAKHRMAEIASGRTQLGTEGTRSSFKPRGEETRRRIREYRASHRTEHGRYPSNAAVGRALGMDPSTVHEQMNRMHVSETSTAPRYLWSTDALIEAGTHDLHMRLSGFIDDFSLAYHHGEIAEAVNALPEEWAQFVRDCFWGGLTEAESNRLRDSAVRWRRVKPVLAQRLAHLADAA